MFGALAHNDARFGLNLLVSSGQELVTTAADYLDYALAQESTRVVGLFLETIRDPDGFCRALARGREREIPIVALKVGRTERSRAMALSHTGAMTGDDGAFDALCEHHGVARVASLDELAATLLLFGSGRRAAPGGLVTIHDSGGEREMLADLAAEIDIPFAALAPDTRARLQARLEPGLEADNPLDAWGTGRDFEAIFTDCLQALVDDPDAALGMLFADIRDGYYVSEGYAAAAAAVAACSGKPVALATNFSGVRHDGLAARLTRSGVPVLDGTAEALCAARHLLSHRDLLARTHAPAPPPPAGARARWEAALRAGRPLDESTSLALLADYGLEAAPSRIVEGEAEAVAALQALGRPVALKSAAAGILHKSDRAGVHLGLRDEPELVAAYRELARRLGPRALVQRMAPAGVELVFGARIDAQFGPVVIIGGGGVWIEVLRDVAYGLAPLASDAARRLIGRLRVRPLLEGARGRRPADLDRLVEALVRFSVMVADLGELLAEVDVNPVIAGAEGTLAVDALIVPAEGGGQDGAEP